MKRGRLTRRTELARSMMRRRPKRRPVSKREFELRLEFGREKERSPVCANCGYRGPWLEVHHAVDKALLKRMLSNKGQVTPPEVVWDRRNAVVACGDRAPNRCHGRHSLAFARMGSHVLRSETWEFAREHGLEHVLEARYGQEAA